MTNLVLGYENFADDEDAVYSGGSWQRALDNLKTPYVREVARSTNLDLASTQFSIDLGADRTFKLWCLTHTNLTADALIRLTWYDASAVEIDNSGWVAVNAFPDIDPEGIGAAHFHIFAAPVTARSGLCEISDEMNPAGFVQIGRNLMTGELGISRNPDVGMGDGMEENSPRKRAQRGTRFVNRRIAPRKASMAYNVMFEPDDAARIRRMRRYCNLDKQVVLIPDPDDTANYFERNFVGTLDALPALSLLDCDFVGASGFEILEVV